MPADVKTALQLSHETDWSLLSITGPTVRAVTSVRSSSSIAPFATSGHPVTHSAHAMHFAASSVSSTHPLEFTCLSAPVGQTAEQVPHMVHVDELTAGIAIGE